MQMATRPLLASIRAMRRSAAACACAAGSATTMISLSARPLLAIGIHLSPAPAVAGQKLVRQLRPFAAGLVGLQSLGAGFLPRIQEWLHGLPARLDTVGALEQDIVANHAVIDQCFIAGARLGLEVVLVTELH